MDEAHVLVIGDDGALRRERRPVPPPGPGELRLDVAAVGLNRADLLQRAGHYPAPPGVPADVPGLECAGSVTAVGPGVTGWSTGDRAMALLGGGAFSSALTVRADQLLPVPDRLDLPHAAAVPEAFLTAHDALFGQAGLARGEHVLIHAAGSGVGTAAVQLARRAGAVTLGTSRSVAKLERCSALGLDVALHVPKGADFTGAVRQATDGRGVDALLDTVGAAYLESNLGVLARGARMVCLGLMGGARGTLDLGRLLSRRARLIGTVLRSRSLDEKAALVSTAGAELLPGLGDGSLLPVVDDVLPMAAVEQACERMAADATFGKLVLTW